MASKIDFRTIEGRSFGYILLLACLGALVLLGLGSAWVMEHNGHHITGMNNQIVWGMPHVFAVFLVVAASGALNVASIASVFGKTAYKPLSRLSGLLALALLMGGLAALVLDLGRPDRLIVAMTTYNFKSIFAWNIYLYIGFMVIVAVYLWFQMERRMQRYRHRGGLGRLSLAADPDHRYGVDLRLPGGARGLRRRGDGAAVHRHVVFLRTGDLPAGHDGVLRLDRPAAGRQDCSGAWASCWRSSSPRCSISRPPSI